MKKIFSTIITAALGTALLSGCIEEYTPQTDVPSFGQVSKAPGSFANQVANLSSILSGKRLYSPRKNKVWDFGYTSFFLTRDVEGMDIVPNGANNAYSIWYSRVQYLAPGYAICQLPWTLYYGWIKDCNAVLKNAGAINYAAPMKGREEGAGLAYAMRAMHYLDLVRMYASKPYSVDPKALTTIKADEVRTKEDAIHQERMTWEEAFAFILKDLDHAEKYLANFKRQDKYTLDLSVVYGLKARTYLEMQDWKNAELYAKKAQAGYKPMTKEEFLSHDNGFNTPNDSWMFATQFKSTDPSIQSNDGDDSWGSVMIPEAGWEGGYASHYGGVMQIDKHLFTTIPESDFRRMCWVDFALDGMKKEEALKRLTAYTSVVPSKANKFSKFTGEERIYNATVLKAKVGLGGYSMKFRQVAGKANTKYDAWCVSVPLMRVEEMMLIEAEAAGMQDEARGKTLLENFAKLRDPNYVYGKHNEAYYNNSTKPFQNEVWWQRRVELWGEGFATFDIKRLNKGIIRSYEGTNHVETARWNTPEGVPNWMVWTFVGTEADNNGGMTQNPDPVQPTKDSDPYTFINSK